MNGAHNADAAQPSLRGLIVYGKHLLSAHGPGTNAHILGDRQVRKCCLPAEIRIHSERGGRCVRHTQLVHVLTVRIAHKIASHRNSAHAQIEVDKIRSWPRVFSTYSDCW